MKFEIDITGIPAIDEVAKLVCANEPRIVSYTRMERAEACPVCQAVDGMTISADDTDTYNKYELLHYGCYGYWWANYEDDPGADIVDWKDPEIRLQEKYMSVPKQPPPEEMRSALQDWYSKKGLTSDFDNMTPKQLRESFNEVAGVDKTFANRYRMKTVNANYLSADVRVVNATEDLLASGLRNEKELRAALKAQGFDEYRINKYLSSKIGQESINIYTQLDALPIGIGVINDE